jgi:hypothetical protein
VFHCYLAAASGSRLCRAHPKTGDVVTVDRP